MIIKETVDNIKCSTFHLVDDWTLVDPQALPNSGCFKRIVDAIEYCTKACCALRIGMRR